MKNPLTSVENSVDVKKVVDGLIDQAVNGVPGFKSAHELADDYLFAPNNNGDVDVMIKNMVRAQAAKASCSGFVSGLGGLVTSAVTIPANLYATILVNLRMSATIAVLYGYNLNSDQVRTFLLLSLIGDNAAKKFLTAQGIEVGKKMTLHLIKKIPGKVLRDINKKLGARLIAKTGTKSTIVLTKMVPVVGGIVGAAFESITTLGVAKAAVHFFRHGGHGSGQTREGIMPSPILM